MEKPSRKEDKYWQGTRNFDHIQYEFDLEDYIAELEERIALLHPPVLKSVCTNCMGRGKSHY